MKCGAPDTAIKQGGRRVRKRGKKREASRICHIHAN
jgi:hypothetical protein